MAYPYWPASGVPYQLLDYVSSTQALSLVPGGNTVLLNVSGGGGGFNPDPQFSTITVAGQTTLQADTTAANIGCTSVSIAETGFVAQFLDTLQTSTITLQEGTMNAIGGPQSGFNLTRTDGPNPVEWASLNAGAINLTNSPAVGGEDGTNVSVNNIGNLNISTNYVVNNAIPTIEFNNQWMTVKQNLGIITGTAPANGSPSTFMMFSTTQDHLYRLTIPLTAGTTDPNGVVIIGPTNALNTNKTFLPNIYSQSAYGNSHSCPSVMWVHNTGVGTEIQAYQVGNVGTSDVSLSGSGAAILEDLGKFSIL